MWGTTPLNRTLLVAIALTTLAGCTQAPDSAAKVFSTDPSSPEETTLDAEAYALGQENVSITYDGYRIVRLVACPKVAPCIANPSEDLSSLHEVEWRNYTHAHLTATWQASSPTMKRFQLSILKVTKDENGTRVLRSLSNVSAGPSPLVLDSDVKPSDKNDTIVIAFGIDNLLPSIDAGFYSFSTGQSFHVEGTLIAQPKEGGDSEP